MTNIIQEIIEIKLQMIKVFNCQINYLKKNEISKLKDLQNLEESLVTILKEKQKIIKESEGIISSCKDYQMIELLKDTCIEFEKTLNIKHMLLEKAMFINNKILDNISQAFKEVNNLNLYNNKSTTIFDNTAPIIVNCES